MIALKIEYAASSINVNGAEVLGHWGGGIVSTDPMTDDSKSGRVTTLGEKVGTALFTMHLFFLGIVRDLGRIVFPAVLESVVVAVHLQDMDVVGEALRAEDLGPLIEGQDLGHNCGSPLEELAEDLGEQFRLGAGNGTNPNSSMVSRLSWDSCRCKFSRRLSSLASISSWTKPAAVVKPTESSRWQAAKPSPRATWVLPVPLLSTATTFSRVRMYSQRASSITKPLFSDGMAGKSMVSRLLTAGKRAARIRRSTMRWWRSMSSNSASLSRYSGWSTFSAAHWAVNGGGKFFCAGG